MLALRLRRGDGVTTKAGQVVRHGEWPRDVTDQMVRTGAMEHVSVAPDGTATPAAYRATRRLKDGVREYQRGDVVPGVTAWPAFLSLLNERYIEPTEANVAQPAPAAPVAYSGRRGRR